MRSPDIIKDRDYVNNKNYIVNKSKINLIKEELNHEIEDYKK